MRFIVRVTCLSCVFAASSFAQPATAPTAQPATNPAAAAMAAEYLKLPAQRVNSLSEIVRIRRDADRLAAWSAADRLDDKTRYDVPNVNGAITLQPLMTRQEPPQPGDPAEPTEPRFFTFQHYDTPAPGVESNTMVNSGGGRLSLARDIGPDDAVLSVQLIQAPPVTEPNPNDPTLRLYVSKGSRVLVRVGADSFAQLCSQYPREVEEYVRPLLRELGSEAAVFAPDPRGVWQVFADGYEPDAATREKVNAILQRLDVADFQTREAAAGELEALGQPAALMLMNVNRSSMSAEKQSNIESFLAPYQPYTSPDVKRLREDSTFLIDALSVEDAKLRGLAWKRLKEVAKPDVEFDPNANETVRAEQITKLRAFVARAARP